MVFLHRTLRNTLLRNTWVSVGFIYLVYFVVALLQRNVGRLAPFATVVVLP